MADRKRWRKEYINKLFLFYFKQRRMCVSFMISCEHLFTFRATGNNNGSIFICWDLVFMMINPSFLRHWYSKRAAVTFSGPTQNPSFWYYYVNIRVFNFRFQLMHYNFISLIILLYMFRAPMCPSSGGSTIHSQQLVQCHLFCRPYSR